MVRLLTKVTPDGVLYTRPAAIEIAIRVAIQQDIECLRGRAELWDESEKDFLPVRGGGPGYQNGGPPFAKRSLRLSLSIDHLRTVLAVKGSLRRAQQRRALDGSGPF